MKRILIAIPYAIVAIISLLMGFFTWVWTFKSDDFYKGSCYINNKIKFTDWLED